MARPLKPLVRGGGYYPSRKWTPLVYNGGYTKMDGGGEPPEPPTPVYWKTITGFSPLTLPKSVVHSIKSLTQFGKCVQDGTPTPSAPVDILCNNGALRYSANMANVNEQTALVGYYISAQGVVTADPNNWIYQEYVPVLPNTAYTLSMSSSVYYVTISEYSTAEDSGFVIRKNGSTGTNTSLTITTGATTNYIRFGANVDRAAVTLERVLAINWMFNIGDTALPYHTFGELYADGTPEVLTVGGVNLCNPDYYQGDGWYVGANNTVTAANANGTLVMPCKPNTTYSWWHTAGAGGCRAFELPTETVTKGQEATWAVGSPVYDNANVVKKCTTSATAKTLCIAFARVDSNVGRTIEEQLADFMLVEGDIEEAFAYQPYHEPQTVTDIPMLLSVNDYKDSAEIISGIKTGAVGVLVLDGTESWQKVTGYNAYYVILQDMRYCNPTEAGFSTHFVGNGSATASMPDNTVKLSYTSGGTGAIMFKCNAYTTIADWTAFVAAQYAAGTPVIVVYPLATATTEQTTPHALNSYDGTTIITADTNVDPVTLEVEYASSEE